MSLAIDLPKDKIAEFCHRWRIVELYLFGSVLRKDFRPDSDVDVLVTFAEGTHLGIREWLQMEQELENLLGRKVDLVERKQVERSRNYIRRRHILDHAVPVYVA